jgi:hypothetical protein
MVEGVDHVVVHEPESRVALKMSDVVRVPSEEIVQADNLMAVGDEGIAEVRAEESGASSD